MSESKWFLRGGRINNFVDLGLVVDMRFGYYIDCNRVLEFAKLFYGIDLNNRKNNQFGRILKNG